MTFLRNIFINETELQGEKDIYYYFNLINEKFETKIFYSSGTESSILSTEPLIYKIKSNVFPNNARRVPDVWKTNIRVVLKKKDNGTVFHVYPKTGITTWIVYCMLAMNIIVKFINGSILKQPAGILGLLLTFAIFYLLDRFAKTSLIHNFKEEVLSN